MRVGLSFDSVILLGKTYVGKGGTKLFTKFKAFSCTPHSLSDLYDTVCTKHERSSRSIKAEGVLKAGDYCSLPFLFFLYKWACPNPSKESTVREHFVPRYWFCCMRGMQEGWLNLGFTVILARNFETPSQDVGCWPLPVSAIWNRFHPPRQ